MQEGSSNSPQRQNFKGRKKFASSFNVSHDILLYKDLQKCILNFQLLEHQTFLEHFNQLYQIIDIDKKGVIDSNQFQLQVFIMNEILIEY